MTAVRQFCTPYLQLMVMDWNDDSRLQTSIDWDKHHKWSKYIWTDGIAVCVCALNFCNKYEISCSKILVDSSEGYYVFQIKWHIKCLIFSAQSVYEFCVILIMNSDFYLENN